MSAIRISKLVMSKAWYMTHISVKFFHISLFLSLSQFCGGNLVLHHHFISLMLLFQPCVACWNLPLTL